MENFLENYKLEGNQLNIYTWPAPVLKKVADPVTEFNDELRKLIKDMLFTMYHAPGIGLAAPQVGVSKRLFVLDIWFDRDEVTKADGTLEYRLSNFNPIVLINPVFTKKEGDFLYEEGCLSVPGVYEDVKRAKSVSIDYQDMFGNKQTLDADDLLSVCLQHENDHLDGVVFIERLSPLKRQLVEKKFLKTKKKI